MTPWHYVPVLARKPGALRNGAPFQTWVLPGALERVRHKLAAAAEGDRQMVEILSAVLSAGLAAVEAACAEALAGDVHCVFRRKAAGDFGGKRHLISLRSGTPIRRFRHPPRLRQHR